MPEKEVTSARQAPLDSNFTWFFTMSNRLMGPSAFDVATVIE